MRAYHFVLLSIVLHLLFSYGAETWLPRFATLAEIPKPTKIEWVELDPKKKTKEEREAKQFVRATEVPENLKTQEKKKSRFFSEKDQNVLEETRVQQTGLTANRSNDSKPNKSAEEFEEAHKRGGKEAAKLKAEDLLPRDYGSERMAAHAVAAEKGNPDDKEDDSKPLILPNVGMFGHQNGPSTVGELLPNDIRIGNLTALNADRYLYYSFYARIEAMVRFRWIRMVRSAIGEQEQAHNRIHAGTYSTRAEILLDKDGHFVHGILHEQSGVKGFDVASVAAFKEASFFPNPPQEMVKEDGMIHLEYQFNVNFDPQYAGGN